MTPNPAVWVVAALEVIAALAIVTYWVTWFREQHDEPWLPDGYVDHERPFVYADALLAVILVVAAVLQVTDRPTSSTAVLITSGPPIGESLGLVAAGMLAFLGILDLAYFARTGLFEKEHGGLVNVGVVSGTLLLSLILVLRFL